MGNLDIVLVKTHTHTHNLDGITTQGIPIQYENCNLLRS